MHAYFITLLSLFFCTQTNQQHLDDSFKQVYEKLALIEDRIGRIERNFGALTQKFDENARRTTRIEAVLKLNDSEKVPEKIYKYPTKERL